MKTKNMMIFGIVIIFIMAFTSISFGQVTWYSNGLGLSNLSPGKVGTDTLRFILGENSELTRTQTLTLDFTDFTVVTGQVAEKSNYSFSQSPSATKYADFHMDTSDFSLSYSSTLKQLTFTLLTENSLLPGDSTVLIISNALANPGKSGGSSDVRVKVKTTDQPVFSSSEYDVLTTYGDQVIGAISIADSNASEYTYMVITDTTEGIIPKDGIFKVFFPSGYSFASTVDSSKVSFRAAGVKLLLASVEASGTTLALTLSGDNSSYIADNTVITITLGSNTTNQDSLVVRNPKIFGPGTSNENTKSYTTGWLNDFYVAAFDAGGDTVFVDKSGGLSYTIVSTWWTDDTGSGGVNLSDPTASNPTQMTLSFKLGEAMSFDTNSAGAGVFDTFFVLLADSNGSEDFNLDTTTPFVKEDYEQYFTFSSGWTDSTKFDIVTWNDSLVGFAVDTAGWKTTVNTLPAQTSLTLVISSTILKNKGMNTDADVMIKTSKQTAWIQDRDDTDIDPNNGGVITNLALADSNAGNSSIIDSLIFVANGEIPSNGQIVIKFPTTFTLASSIDSAMIDTSHPDLANWSIGTSTGRSNTISSITVLNNAVTLQLALSSNIRSGDTIKISLGDTAGIGAADSGKGHISTAAFTNPTPSDSGKYPTIGSRGAFVVETRYSDGSLIMSGNNSTDPVYIRTNAWADSQFTFINKNGTRVDTAFAGDSIGVAFTFKLGTPLIAMRDTLIFDLSNFFVNEREIEDSLNIKFWGNDNTGDWDTSITYNTTSKELRISSRLNDTLRGGVGFDSTIVMQVAAFGKASGSEFGGALAAKGARTNLTVRFRTNHQTSWVTSDTNRLVLALKGDSAAVVKVVKADSAAGETTFDTLYVKHHGVIEPGSKIAVKLKNGFTFGETTVSSANVNLLSLRSNNSTPNFTVTSPIVNDSLVITLASTDTIRSDTLHPAEILDTLKIVLGTSASKIVTNVHPDSLNNSSNNNYGRSRIYQGMSDSSRVYNVYIYDADDNLYQSNSAVFTAPTGDDSIGARILTNTFTDSIRFRAETTTDAHYRPAGGNVDSLIFSFYLGQSLVPGDWLQFKVSGAVMNSDSAAVKSHYVFKGDIAGTGSTDGFTLTITPADSTIRIQLGTGDTLGQGYPISGATTTLNRSIDHLCTLAVANTFRLLGTSSGVLSTVDDINIWLTTSQQATQVQDTSKVKFSVSDYTLNYSTTFLGSSPTAGAAISTFGQGYTNGTSHGYLPNDGIVDVYFPNKNDSSFGTYQYTFAVSDPDSAQNDVAGTNSYKYSSTAQLANFNVSGVNSDTLGISYVLFDTVFGLDSARFRIKLSGSGGSSIEADSSLVVNINSQLYAPKEASDGATGLGGPATGSFAAHLGDADSNGVRIDLRDHRGFLISRGWYTTGQDINPGSGTKLLVLLDGEQHDPGATSAAGFGNGVRGAPKQDTVGTAIRLQVLHVDDYYNIVDLDDKELNLTLPTGIQYKISNDPNASTYHMEMDDGVASYYTGTDTLLSILTAADTIVGLGRGTGTNYDPVEITATMQEGTAYTGTSNVLRVVPQNFAGIMIVPSPTITQTYVPGDTANDGRSNAGQDQLVGGATYTDSVYAVDKYYNRVDSTGLGTNGSISIAQTSGSGVALSTSSVTSWGANGNIGYTMQPSTSGSQVITVTQGAYSGTYSFTAIVAAVKAIFETDPALLNLAGAGIIITVDTLQFNGTFGSGEGFKLWAHTQSGLRYVSSGVGAAQLTTTPIQLGSNASPYANYKDTLTTTSVYFQKNVRYYIYATVDALGDSVIGADNTGVLMQRYPFVATEGRVVTPTTNQTLNSGGYSPSKTYDLQYRVNDYDDAVVNLRIYMSQKSTLDTNSVGVDGWLTEVADTTILIKTATSQDSAYTFDISDTLTASTANSNNPYMLKGTYYVYINAVDGDGQKAVQKSAAYVQVKHSPSSGSGTKFEIDRPVAGNTRVETRDQKYLTINWSTTGLNDLDDVAQLAIYYDTTTANWGTNVSGLLASSTAKLITGGIGGFSLNETDAPPDSLQFTWDISAATSTLLPMDSGYYDFYVLVRDNDDTVMAQSQGDIQFTHSPNLDFMFNLGGALAKGSGAAVRQVVINKGETFRFAWDGSDLDATQYVRLVVSQQDNYNYDQLTFPDEAGTADAWLVNSTDGTQTNAKVVGLTSGVYNWFSGNMTEMDSVDGDYYVYAFVSTDANSTTWSAATTVMFRAEGKFKLAGTEATSSTNYDIQLVPSIFTTNKSDTARVYVYVDSKGETVDEIGFHIRIDTNRFEIIDQNTTLAGVQPYLVEDSYFMSGSGITLVEDSLQTVIATEADTNTGTPAEVYYNLRFRKIDPAVSGGAVGIDTAIASFLIRSKGTDSTTTNYSSFYFDNENVTISNDGTPKNISIPTPAAKVYTNPLGRIRGRIELQGRENFAHTATVELRPYGSLVAITDSEYKTANDIASGINGVQVAMDRDGFFELTKVPTGVYDLVAKVDGWLSGQKRNINIVPGDLETAQDPHYDNSADPVDRGQLYAGDVSSGDAAGYTDNYIDEDDITYMAANYGATPTGLVAKCDINGNGEVDFQDLAWTSRNVGEQGIPPIYNKNSGGGDNTLAYLKLEGLPEHTFKDQEFEVKVWAKNINDLRGYAFTFCYDPDKVEIVNEYMAIDEGDFLASGNSGNRNYFFTIQNKKGLEFVNVLLGNVEPAVGEGVVATVKMKSLIDGERPEVSVVDIMVANSVNRFFRLKDVSQVPDDFGLSQNYPNPFNPETRIKFQLPLTSKVVLKIYNVLGQEVRTLVNNEMTAGYHSIIWDGRNRSGVRVASGIYIYRIKAGSFIASKKMTLLK